MELQTMPLKFRVWDDIEKEWGAIPSHHIGIGLDLLHGDANQEDSRYIISQSTGCKDDEGTELYTGDIVEVVMPYSGQRGVIRFDGVSNVVQFNNDLCDTMFASTSKYHKIGNIWQDGEKLLCPKE